MTKTLSLAPDGRPVWMISNASSGSHDAGLIDSVALLFDGAGVPVTRRFILGESPLPSGAEARAADVALVVIHGGDGTITSATDSLDGWDGDILVLPGGTMNLLAKALHGDRPVEDIAQHCIAQPTAAVRVPTITGGGHCALAGIIVGPTTIWGDVREQLRHADLGALASTIPEALSETLGEGSVRIADHADSYSAVYLQPALDGIAARGVLTRNAADLVNHGLAWLSGDFRDGPHVDLGIIAELTVHGDAPMGLLVDGEKQDGAASMTFRQGQSCHRYLSCLGGVQWP